MLSALPEVLDPTINDLFETEIPELELITDLIFDTRRLMLLPEATEDWITRWEKALQVKPKTIDLEERRRYLITLISSKIKINSVSLQKITKSFTNVNNLVNGKRFSGTYPIFRRTADRIFEPFFKVCARVDSCSLRNPILG